MVTCALPISPNMEKFLSLSLYGPVCNSFFLSLAQCVIVPSHSLSLVQCVTVPLSLAKGTLDPSHSLPGVWDSLIVAPWPSV